MNLVKTVSLTSPNHNELAARHPLFWEVISAHSEVCSVNISRPNADVADWSVHDPELT